MRICMVVSNMNDFGGLEEFARNLAIGVQQQGHQVSVLSTVWVPPDNQYWRSLAEAGVALVQLPKWISLAASDWPTKQKIMSAIMALASPFLFLAAVAVSLLRRQPLPQAMSAARNYLQGKWLNRWIAPDWRYPLVRRLLNWWRRRWRPDLLHIHGYTSTLLFVIEWAAARKVPVVYEEHQTPDAQFDWWSNFGKSINKATTVVAVSETSAAALREVCGVTRPIEVAYCMVPDPMVAGWTPNAAAGAAGAAGADGDRPVRITTSARLYVTKGLDYLLEAIALVRAAHPATQFRVYGDGPLREELLARAQALGLDGSRIFVGAFRSREELSRIMADTDIFAMSSILEGLPIAMLEAMSYGRPIVATRVGGIPEAIEDGSTGLLCAPRDAACLAGHVRALIEDPALRQTLGRAARRAYEQGPFHPLAVCRRFISIYEDALAPHSG
jgi:glycosyltransferase involved in cell wall biosynthesis